MMLWQIAKPIPVPFGLVVKSSLNKCSRKSSGIPSPWSSTEISASSWLWRSTRKHSSRLYAHIVRASIAWNPGLLTGDGDSLGAMQALLNPRLIERPGTA